MVSWGGRGEVSRPRLVVVLAGAVAGAALAAAVAGAVSSGDQGEPVEAGGWLSGAGAAAGIVAGASGDEG